MKKMVNIFVLVPFLILLFYVPCADTQTDPGLIKWLNDHQASINTNRQLIDHEQRRRMELETMLINMLNNQNMHLRTYISSLEERIRRLEIQGQNHEQAIKKLIQ